MQPGMLQSCMPGLVGVFYRHACPKGHHSLGARFIQYFFRLETDLPEIGEINTHHAPLRLSMRETRQREVPFLFFIKSVT